jgi:hypothetical protein
MEVLWTNFLTPFSSTLWAAVFSVMALTVMGLMLTDTATRRDKSNEILKTSHTALNSIFCIFGSFCQQGKLQYHQSVLLNILCISH